MRKYPEEIIKGVEVLMYACQSQKAIIAVEEDKIDAIIKLNQTIKNKNICVEAVPIKYSTGAEKLLIKLLLDKEIPTGSFASSSGVLCQNIATVKAIYDAVITGRPLVSRIVTVNGSALKNPSNYEVRIGSSFSDIVKKSNPSAKPHEIRVGGMMMGVDVPDNNYSICKITSSIIVDEIKVKQKESACIRCSKCNEVCPINLLPQQLFWFCKSDNTKKASSYDLQDCIECGCCSYVCPSHIPLVEYFQYGKALVKKELREQELAAKSRERYEFKEFRLDRIKQERDKMMAEKKAALKAKMAKEKDNKAKIAEALKRVNDKKK
jgi:electron transport complex protein RnfC